METPSKLLNKESLIASNSNVRPTGSRNRLVHSSNGRTTQSIRSISKASLWENRNTVFSYIPQEDSNHSNYERTLDPLRDDCEISLQPSYKIKKFAYDLNCRLRYAEAKKMYERQFQRDLQHCISTEHSIGEQYLTRSAFCYTSLWPPLHTKRELEYFVHKFFKLPPKMEQRLRRLMTTDLSKSF